MKRFKSGFSLAEVLLALAIVAIIATLGFTMSRKGIEHAYNAVKDNHLFRNHFPHD